MKVLLIDADSKMPNLALMKLGAFHKKQGDEIYLRRGLAPELPLDFPDPDIAYISCIFDKNKEKTFDLVASLRKIGIKTLCGGPAIIGDILPEEVEHILPDYGLYGIDYSMGFTSRGCIRYCPWCRVPLIEGRIKSHADMSEFLHPNHKKLILLDNNLLAAPNARETLEELARRGLLVNFNQGLDIRLITDENASLLSRIRYYDRRFKNRRLHFAFDQPGIADQVKEGIAILERNGIPRRHLMSYILIRYNTSFQQDMERVNTLIKEKVLPYIMPYNDDHSDWAQVLEEWINGRWYQFIPWEKFDRGNSQQVIRAMKVER
jgi:hypothetical protein